MQMIIFFIGKYPLVVECGNDILYPTKIGVNFAMNYTSPNIFIIGTASLDTLHLANGKTVHTAGGAGLYTALAAHHAGTETGLFAPKPAQMPEQLQPTAARLQWLGPEVSLDMLPRLEIKHHGGGKATLVGASWGAEPQMEPHQLPANISQVAIVHIAALSSAGRQLAFLETLKAASPGKRPLVSVGTYARLVYGDTHTVRQLFEQADLFFMNENEANGLFGSVENARTKQDGLLFVTLDVQGALVIEGKMVTHVPGHPVPELDPTGAGDTFCGAVLAGLAQGMLPVEAAREAVKLAAKTVSAVGPEALIR